MWLVHCQEPDYQINHCKFYIDFAHLISTLKSFIEELSIENLLLLRDVHHSLYSQRIMKFHNTTIIYLTFEYRLGAHAMVLEGRS